MKDSKSLPVLRNHRKYMEEMGNLNNRAFSTLYDNSIPFKEKLKSLTSILRELKENIPYISKLLIREAQGHHCIKGEVFRGDFSKLRDFVGCLTLREQSIESFIPLGYRVYLANSQITKI